MSTLADAVVDATAAENAAVDALNAAAALLRSKAGTAQGVIDAFTARPLYTAIFCDPAGGNDASDGKTVTTPKRDLDALLANIGSQGTQILLLNNAILRRRVTISTNVQIIGCVPNGQPGGWSQTRRTISFLGEADNSGAGGGQRVCAGMFFNAGSLVTDSIDFYLPDVPAIAVRSHLTSSAFVNMQFNQPTVTVATSNAGALFGSFNNGRLTVTASVTLGYAASGHLFEGIAGGADPNASWNFNTNIRSA